jgi:hypothetical protein
MSVHFPRSLSHPHAALFGLAFLLTLWLAACSAPPPSLPDVEFILPAQLPSQITGKWDGAAGNVVYLKYLPWDRLFDLHLFEELTVAAPDYPRRHFFNNRRINADLWQWRRTPDGLAFDIVQNDIINFELHGTLTSQGNQVHVAGTVVNHMPTPWKSAMGLVCLRCRNAPGFEDLNGERIFARTRDGREMTPLQKDGPYRPEIPDSRYFAFPVNMPGERPPFFQPEIRKRDQTGRRQVSLAATPCRSLLGNRDNALCCIHSNVDLNVPPGGTLPFKLEIKFEDLPTSHPRTP